MDDDVRARREMLSVVVGDERAVMDGDYGEWGIDVLAVRNALASEIVQKGEESFHGLKRESATMEVGESIGCTCQLPSD